MEITDITPDGYEKVVRCHDAESGLTAYIAVHDTTLGPALGGLRMWPYSSEDEARFDVLRLAKGMSYKSAVAHTGLGGGKSVIVGDPSMKSEALYLAMGRFVDSLGGLYITAEDVNTTVGDLEIVRRATKNVAGLSLEMGGSGNPSPYTAYGVFLGIKAALGEVFGSDDPKGRTVSIQGVGAVGSVLARRLVEAGAKVIASDHNEAKLKKVVDDLGVTPVGAGDALRAECDVFAPCALGAIINDETVDTLNCKILAGATNNPLLGPEHGEALHNKGILYAPDYVINAGGIISVSVEFREGGYDQQVALEKVERIPQALRELWAISKEEGIATYKAADTLAQKILADAKAAKA